MNQLDINLSLLENEKLVDVFKYIALSMGAKIDLKIFRYALVNKNNI